MDYRAILDGMRDTLPLDEFMTILCTACAANLHDMIREGITEQNQKEFMYAIVLYADYMKAYLKTTMPPAWGHAAGGDKENTDHGSN